IRTQADYFGALGLGLPSDRIALARELALHLVPRIENDETFKPAQIAAVLRDAARKHDAHTVIFFGLRNQVLGYPDAIDATAAAMRADRLDFGTVETYDVRQNQSGSEKLAQDLPSGTVRVQAIAKAELVRRIAEGVRRAGLRVGTASPFPRFVVRPVEIAFVSLAVPSVLLLL